MAHTLGPWELEIDIHEPEKKADEKMIPTYAWIWAGDDSGKRKISTVVMRMIRDDTDVANMKLIAAAPELLAACKAALHRLYDLDDEKPSPSELYAQIESAIAKAEQPQKELL